jgi:hypothetical protein
MSVLDVVVWLLPPLAGVVLGLWMRSTVLAFLLGPGLVITSIALWGYSADHYSNNDCQPGQPCPTGEPVIRVVIPGFFLLGSTLFLVAFARSLWNEVRRSKYRGVSRPSGDA